MYLLPTHVSYISDDPLGICDSETAAQQAIIHQLIETRRLAILELQPNLVSTSFVQLLEDLAYTIHRNGQFDASGLKAFLDHHPSQTALVSMLDFALALPELLPSAELSQLPQDAPSVTFPGPLVNSILAHQAIGTLYQPQGNTWGIPCFTQWYPSTSAMHSKAVEGYLTTLFNHFENPYRSEDSFSFYVCTCASMPDPNLSSAVPSLTVLVTAEFSEPLDASAHLVPYVLVSANKQPGPGPTGTQEERWQSASPALSLSSLIVPVIPDDSVVITSPFPIHSGWNGHNKSAKMRILFPQSERPMRQYILADAMPLDEAEPALGGGLVDLQPGHVEREIRKLYAAFSGAIQHRVHSEGPCIVEAPPWGCGAFCGNMVIKAVCMLIAGGLAQESSNVDLTVQLSLTTDRAAEARFITQLVEKRYSVKTLWGILTDEKSGHSSTYTELFQV